MKMEFRILNRMLEGHDFYEGIRAVLVDKGDAKMVARDACRDRRNRHRTPISRRCPTVTRTL
jgi:hypothetical protein